MLYLPERYRREGITRRPVFKAPRAPMRGEYAVRFLNADGTPALATILDHHGDEIGRRHELPVRPNLITNAGLDDCVLGSSFAAMRNQLRVGTGSTAPDVGDTALVAQAQVSATSGLGASEAFTYVGSLNETRRLTSIVSKRVTMTADRNLTEFGLSRLAASNLFVRELFRDELGNPITITLLTDKILELVHTLTVDLPRSGGSGSVDIEDRDAANNLVGTTTFDVEVGFDDSNSSIAANVATTWHTFLFGYGTANAIRVYASRPSLPATIGASATSFSSVPATEDWPPAPWGDTYSLGSFQRDFRGVVRVDRCNIEFEALAMLARLSNVVACGINIRLDNAAAPFTFEKLPTHTLEVWGRTSWGRA